MKTKIIKIIIGIIISCWVSSSSANDLSMSKTAIFAQVINVAKDDVLNVRDNPNYKAGKIGEVYSSSILGVDICQTTNKSTWCKIGILTNLEEMETGWVNARFLDLKGKHASRGYVKITGRPNSCYYSIKCEYKAEILMCMIANSDFSDPTINQSSKPTIEWVKRDNLHAGTAFDSAPENFDGYCINGSMIDDHYK